MKPVQPGDALSRAPDGEGKDPPQGRVRRGTLGRRLTNQDGDQVARIRAADDERDVGDNYDPAKAAAKKQKHGIDFEEAKNLWRDDARLIVPTAWVEEERLLAIGRIDEKIWTAVFAYRAERIRLISVPRARDEEVLRYEENFRR